MPREFENLSNEVSEGAQDVEKSLDGMVKAAEKADVAHGKLSDTQKSSLEISQKFSTAVSDLNKKLGSVAKTGVAAAGGIGSVSVASRGLAVDMSDLSTRSADAARGLGDLTSATKDVRDVGADAAKTAAGLAKESKVLGKEMEDVGGAAKKTSQVFRDLDESADSLSGQMDKLSSITDLAKSKFAEGKREADSFVGGLGATSGVMLGSGVAAVFLAGKVSELIDRFQDAAKELASFNVELSRMAMITPGVDSSQLVELRKELNLTRTQATEFYQVLRQGAQSGLVTVTELTDAAAKLQAAFGGDPTARLREFVELVETIPTLEADLRVTASLDDQTASLFALAKAGKISTVIELQTAGLLGGVDVSVTSPEDVEMLNEQQKALRTQEDIKDFLVNKLFPTWGPQFGIIAKTGLGTLAAVGGGIAALGALKVMMGAQVVAQRETTAAVLASKGAQMGGKVLEKTVGKGIGGAIRRGFARIKGQFKLGAFRGGGPARPMGALKGGLTGVFKGGGLKFLAKETFMAAKSMKVFTVTGKAVTKFGNILKVAGGGIAGPAAIVSAALGLAGSAATWLAKKLQKDGHEVAGGLSEVAGEGMKAAATIAGFAAAGALAGSVIPGLGNAIGAVAGGLIGLGVTIATSTDSLGVSMESFGKTLQDTEKYSKGAQAFGKALMATGKFVKGFGKAFRDTAVKGIKGLGQIIARPFVEVGKAVGGFVSGIWNNIWYTDKEVKARKDSAKTIRGLSRAFKDATKPNEELAKAQRAAQKQIQDSALSLERQLNAIAKVAEGTKAQLAELQAEVGGVELDFLREIGGTAAQFESAIGKATEGTVGRFKVLNRGLAQRRAEVLRDAKLTTEQRRAALDELKKAELEATRTFVEGLSKVIEGLLETPGIVVSEMKREIQSQKFELGIDAGALDLDEFAEGIGKEIDDGLNALEGTFNQLGKMEEVSKKRREMMKKEADRARSEFQSVFASMPKDIKDRFKTIDIDVEKLKPDELDKVIEEANKGLKGINQRVEKMTDGLAVIKEGTARGLSQQAAAVAKELEDYNDEMGDAQKDLKKAGEGSEDQVKAQETVNRIAKAQIKLQQEQANIAETTARWARKQTNDEDVVRILQAKILGNREKVRELTSKNADAAKKATKLFKELQKKETEDAGTLNRRTRLLEEQAKLTKAVDTAQSIINAERSAEVADLKDQQKIQQKLIEQTQAIRSAINKVTTEAVKGVKEAKREADLTEARAEIARTAGKGLENLAKQTDADVKVAEKVRQARDTLSSKLADVAKRIEKTTDPTQLKALEAIRQTLKDKLADLDKEMYNAQGKLIARITSFG